MPSWDVFGAIGQLMRSSRAKLLFDLTVYLDSTDEATLDNLLRLYEDVCSPRDRVLYTIDELFQWAPVDQPVLTKSGREAAARGVARPYLEPLRRRIRDGRPFALSLWDGRDLRVPDGSWNLSFQSSKVVDGQTRSFVRCLMPLHVPHIVLRSFATAVASNISFVSGHGGLTFAYDPWDVERTFDIIYALCQRYWGVDIEYLSATLPLMDRSIKGVSWITMLGRAMVEGDQVAPALAALKGLEENCIEVFDLPFGAVFVAGAQPALGDRHRGMHDLEPQITLARVLRSLFLNDHPDFPGQRFIEHANTLGWVRRFLEPNGWN